MLTSSVGVDAAAGASVAAPAPCAADVLAEPFCAFFLVCLVLGVFPPSAAFFVSRAFSPGGQEVRKDLHKSFGVRSQVVGVKLRGSFKGLGTLQFASLYKSRK